MNDDLSVREINKDDINLIVSYWLNAAPAFLTGMGVDLKKVPHKNEFTTMLSEQLTGPIEKRKSYCVIWQVNNKAIGHSNVNKILFGEEAFMHLHIWQPAIRKKGYGTTFVKMSLPYFFENLHLKKLYCEPYALNPGPNKTLEKVGFRFVKEYITIPGYLNFEQPVKRWEMSYERFLGLRSGMRES